uniref:Major facilitator superfamily (MFS) profile domain-containing protein n=1 Tax=Alexandrium monilatum TaxID=311494 RepID=A0A7S4SNH5_9DINO
MTAEDPPAATSPGRARWCCLRLGDGVRGRHISVYYFGAFMTVGVSVGCSTLQPFLMTSLLGLGADEQGAIGAAAKSLGEAAAALLAGGAGLLSDRLGRRAVYACCLLLAALGLGLLPLSRGLAVFYALTAVSFAGTGAAAAVMVAIPGDYVFGPDRGKANGLVAVANGLGAVCVGMVSGRLPGLAASLRPFAANRAQGIFAYGALAVAAAATALTLGCGLAGRGVQRGGAAGAGALDALRAGLRLARGDRALVLACLAAAAARSDGQIAFFFSQWCVSASLRAAAAAAGLSPDAPLPPELREAAVQRGLAHSTQCVGLVGLAGLLAGAVWGRLADSMDRAATLSVALLAAAVAYAALALCPDPFGARALVVALLVGLCQTGVVVSSQAFVQERAPAEVRGLILGVFGLCGGVGQIVSTFAGGQLFAHWAFQGPFVWVCGVNLLVFSAGLVLVPLHRCGRPPATGSGVLLDGCGLRP